MSEAAGAWTVLRLINWTRDYLGAHGVEAPRLSAEVLLADVLGCSRIDLYTQFDRLVGPGDLARYRQAIRRAAAGEPISYIRGFKEFYSLSFKVTPDVLIPRPETELLVDVVLELVRAAGGPVKLWDACTGSGCVPVSAARYARGLEALATDISQPALAVAAENAARCGVADRVHFALADLLELPERFAAMAPFDVITANPPYVSDGQMAGLPVPLRAEPELALRAGPTGLECIRPILADAPGRLRPGGLLAVEVGLGQAEEVYDMAQAVGRYREVRFLKDLAGIERVMVAEFEG